MSGNVLFSGPQQHEPPMFIWSLQEIVCGIADLAAELIGGSETCELPPVLEFRLQGLIAAVPELEDALGAFNSLVQDHEFRGQNGEPDPSPDRTVPLISGQVDRIGRNLDLVMAGLSLLYDLARGEAVAMDAATIALTAGRAGVLPLTATVVSLVEAPDAE